MCPHFGHPCQKQPSAKRASRSLGKTKSGVPGTCRGRTTQPCKSARASNDPSLLSVVRLRAEAIAFMLLLLALDGGLNGGRILCFTVSLEIGGLGQFS